MLAPRFCRVWFLGSSYCHISWGRWIGLQPTMLEVVLETHPQGTREHICHNIIHIPAYWKFMWSSGFLVGCTRLYIQYADFQYKYTGSQCIGTDFHHKYWISFVVNIFGCVIKIKSYIISSDSCTIIYWLCNQRCNRIAPGGLLSHWKGVLEVHGGHYHH